MAEIVHFTCMSSGSNTSTVLKFQNVLQNLPLESVGGSLGSEKDASKVTWWEWVWEGVKDVW